MLFLLIIFALLSSINSAEFNETDFSPCAETTSGRLIALRTEHCESFPCEIYVGNTYYFEIEFETGTSGPILGTYLTAFIAGVEVNWPGAPEGDTCDLIVSGSCPYDQGQILVYNGSITITEVIPQVNLSLRWRLRDLFGQSHVCINIPLNVRDLESHVKI